MICKTSVLASHLPINCGTVEKIICLKAVLFYTGHKISKMFWLYATFAMDSLAMNLVSLMCQLWICQEELRHNSIWSNTMHLMSLFYTEQAKACEHVVQGKKLIIPYEISFVFKYQFAPVLKISVNYSHSKCKAHIIFSRTVLSLGRAVKMQGFISIKRLFRCCSEKQNLS